MFGTCVAETILASVHVRTHQQAGHMDASDLVKLSRDILQVGGRPHKGSDPSTMKFRPKWHLHRLGSLDLPLNATALFLANV
jgi:hypothetical protein